MADALVTCIVLKPHVTLMDIVSTKMLGQFGFLVRMGQVMH
jgi:nitrate reductase NapE component